MRLTSLRLQNFRGVEDKTVEFSDGVTIVAGPNEVGKSSFMEALGLLRSTKHNSTKQQVRSLQPVGKDVGPRATLTGSVGGRDFEYTKQWVKAPSAELTIKGRVREDHTNHEAHDRFDELLKENLDLDLFDALEVAQGESLDQPKLGSIRALRTALETVDSAEGSSADGNGGDASKKGEEGESGDLMVRVQAERDRYFTAKGNPAKELKAAIEARKEAQEKLGALEDQVQEIQKHKEKHEKQTLEKVENQKKLGRATTDLRRFTEEQKKVDEAQAAVKDAQSAQVALDAKAESAQMRWDTHERNAKALEKLKEELSQKEAEEAAAKISVEDAAAEHEAAKERAEAARKAAGEAVREEEAAVALVERTRDTIELGRLQKEKTRLEEAMEDRAKAEATLKGSNVDDTALNGLVELSTKVAQAKSALEAASATVDLESLGADQILVNGETQEALPTALVATDRLVVEVPGQVRVTVSPPKDSSAYQRDLTEAVSALDEELSRLKVTSIEDARKLNDRRRQAETDKKTAENMLRRLGGEEALTDLLTQMSAVKARLGKDGTLDGAFEGPFEGSAGTLKEEQAKAEVKADKAKVASAKARDAREAADRELQAKTSALDAARTQVENTEVAVQQIKGELEAALARSEEQAVNTEELRAALEKAKDEAEKGRELLEQHQKVLLELDPEHTTELLENAEALVARFRAAIRENDDQIVQMKALLDQPSVIGIYDRHVEAQANFTAAESQEARVQARAAAAALLWETLDKHRAEAHERYVKPLEETIARLGKPIFGRDFAVRIGEDLTIQSRTLGDAYIPFEDLSGGAKEQLSVLGRLAAATLVEEEGAPVILDDTLGFSDPDRLAALGVVLSKMGRSAQVVVLTCQPDRYDSVGRAKKVTLD